MRRDSTHGGAGLGPQDSTTRNERVSGGRRRNSVSSTVLSIADASTSPASIICSVRLVAPVSVTRLNIPVLPESGEVIAHDVVAGVRSRLVVHPARAAQVSERADGAVSAHHDIGEVNGPSRITRAGHYGSSQELDARMPGSRT